MQQEAPLRQQAMQQQVQAGQQDIEAKGRALAQQQAVQRSYANAVKPNAQGQPEIDTDELTKSLATSGHGDAIPGIMESVAKYQETKNNLAKQTNDLKVQGADTLGYAASAIKAANYDPKLAHTILDGLQGGPQIDAVRQQIDSNPAAFKQMVDTAIMQSPAQQKLQNEREVAQIRAGNAANQEMNAWLGRPENKGKDAADYAQHVEDQKRAGAVSQAVQEATNPQIQGSKIAVANAMAQGKSNIETTAAQGANPALATVPKSQIGPATSAAEKANKEYADAKSVSDRMNATMDAARHGNVVSYQIIPEEGTLQITTSQGVHRINKTEIDQYAGGGSLWQRMEGHFGKQLTGQSIPASVMDDMAQIQKIQAEGAQSRYGNTLKSINQTYGSKFQPVQMGGLDSGTAAGAPHPFFAQFGGTALPKP